MTNLLQAISNTLVYTICENIYYIYEVIIDIKRYNHWSNIIKYCSFITIYQDLYYNKKLFNYCLNNNIIKLSGLSILYKSKDKIVEVILKSLTDYVLLYIYWKI